MRRLLFPRLAAYVVCGLLTASAPLAAQEGRARVGSETPPNRGAAPPERGTAPAEREPRPEGESFHVEAVSPELESVLQQWHQRTKGIEKLQGTHTRFVYEQTFFSGSVATGNFYYESPDKGRIDIKPTTAEDKDPKTEGVQIKDVVGNVYNYKKCPSESWICDGKQVIQVNNEAKTFEVLPIPAEQQGANIMDGPLPFLFGLPPDKAKARYEMKLDPQLGNENTYYLIVKPLLKQDASNWSVAHVMLRKETFLPYAVKLIAPEGIKSTVYVFNEYEVNDFNIRELFGLHPFRAPLGYAQVQNNAPAQPLRKNGKPITGVPSVKGLKYPEAATVLGRRGYRTIHVVPTRTACKPEMKHIVKEQSPEPGAEVAPNQPIQLILYATQEDIDNYNAENAKGQQSAERPQQP